MSGSPVRYVEADLFAWTPEPAGGYEVCVFSWLSHVPDEQFAAFWEMVGYALRPGGRVLFIDSARTERSPAADHRLPGADESTMTRRLDNRREYRSSSATTSRPPLESDLTPLGFPRINSSLSGTVLDTVFEAEKAIVELDSYQFHGDSLGFHDDRVRDTDRADTAISRCASPRTG